MPSVNYEQLNKSIQRKLSSLLTTNEETKKKEEAVKLKQALSERQRQEEAQKILSNVKELGKTLLRQTPRGIAQFAIEALTTPKISPVFKKVEKTPLTFLPETKAQKILLGEAPIKSATETGKEFIKSLGGEAKIAERFGPTLGIALATLDVIPMLPGKKEAGKFLTKEASEAIAKSTVPKFISNVLRKEIKNIPEEAVEILGKNLVKVTTPEGVEKVTSQLLRTSKIPLVPKPKVGVPEVPRRNPPEIRSKIIANNDKLKELTGKNLIDLTQRKAEGFIPKSGLSREVSNLINRQNELAKELSVAKAMPEVPKATPEDWNKLNELQKDLNMPKPIAERADRAIAKLVKEKDFSQPLTAAIPKELQPLAQEARKYKSAEEFVKARGDSFYHGTTKSGLEGISKSGFTDQSKIHTSFNKATGISFSEDIKSASRFTGKEGGIVESYISRDAKLIDGDTFRKMVDEKYSGTSVRGQELAEEFTVNKLKQQGFDGVDFRKAKVSESFEKEVRIWNLDKIKTKSQLTDLYELQSLAQEARKYKSAEEFVKAQELKPTQPTFTEKTLPINEIKSLGTKGSFDPFSLEYSRKQLEAGKTLELIEVRLEKGKYVVEDGEHRLQAYKELGIKDIPVKIQGEPLTKSQLTDFYELQSLAQEARKYKSAEEFGQALAKPTRFKTISEYENFIEGLKIKEHPEPTYGFSARERRKEIITDFYNQAVKGKVKIPSPLAKTEGVLPATAKIKSQAVGGLPPKVPPTELPPTTPLRATEALPLKETGERYTARELSSDPLYQKTGITTSAVKEAGTIAGELPANPTKWNRFNNAMSKFSTSFKEKIVSDWQRVKELKTEGMKLTGELTPYERRKLMAGRQTARLQKTEEAVRKIDKDILDTSRNLKVKDTELQEEVFDYLKARHAPERNIALGEKAAGITTKEAREIMARLEKSPHVTEIKRIADDLQKFHNETLDILYQGGKPEGVIDKELYDLLKTKYKNHIPLQRVMETDDIAEVLSGRGLAVKGTGLKRAVGSEREVRDIMENIYAARTQAIQRVEKNIVDNETFNFVQDYIKANPEQELFSIVKPHAIGKTFEGKIITKQINDPTVLQFQRSGNPAYIKINDPRLAVALRGVNREQLPAVMRYISTVTRWMSALVTRFNPEFVLSNKIRDMQEAVVYMASQDGFRGATKVALRDPGSINDVKNFIIGKETAGTKLYAQMIEDGGTTGGMALSTRSQIETTLKNIRSTNRNIAQKGFKSLAESIDKWNTVFEDSTRLSAYRTALESGMSREKAAIIAKNVSIDFNEFGTWGPIINSLYMFSNASIQGSAKMIRAMKNPKVAAAVVGTVGASVFAANSWNDKADPEWRNKVSKWDKLNGLNIVIPGTEKFYYISIPVSWGLKPIKVAMEYGTDVLSGQKVGLGDITEGIFTAVLEGYNPVGGTDLASALTPSLIEPFIDIARNRQWTGGKIRPDWNKYAPASTQYFKDLKDSQTGKVLIGVTQSVAEKTGGRIEVSPADAEYILQQITGGPGKFIGKVFNSISAIGKGETPEIRDIPFVSRVFRETPEERFYTTKGENDIIKTLTEQERVRFYDRQAAEKTFEELKKMPVEQRKESYRKLYVENPDLIERVDMIADEEEKELTRLDRQILQLGVENGGRAKYLYKVFKSAEPQERKDLYREYLKKGIISDNVRGQLDYLFANPNKIK